MTRSSLAVVCLAGALLGCTAAPGSPDRTSAPTVASGEAANVAGERYHATELRPGDCIDPMPESVMVTVVPCAVPHAAEFATTYVIPEGPWPGVAELGRLAEDGCGPRMRYVPSRKDEVGVVGLVPREEDWPRNRTAYCLAIPPDGGKLVGRVIL
ncbi:hypothetical protein [Nonomuraea basaltis]|uniref:hypothetical protein n=1 Tax=Nonomuraea basaltis TaxID=2495887 RepID=UPI00110C5F4B|nr:hypothetical protein [Nonomuraea basaltis]TMR97165.1 hypothetical protein EJK15_19370 [Nonomuraea basaltis]